MSTKISLVDILSNTSVNSPNLNIRAIKLKNTNIITVINKERNYSYNTATIINNINFNGSPLTLLHSVGLNSTSDGIDILPKSVNNLLYYQLNVVSGGVVNTGLFKIGLYVNDVLKSIAKIYTSSSAIKYGDVSGNLKLESNIHNVITIKPVSDGSSSSCHLYELVLDIKFL